jgi:hypothetical protein
MELSYSSCTMCPRYAWWTEQKILENAVPVQSKNCKSISSQVGRALYSGTKGSGTVFFPAAI